MAGQYWWQRDDLYYQDNELTFAKRNVLALAEQLPTPSFVYSVGRIESNLRRIKQVLSAQGFSNRHQLYYAMKANRFAPLLTFLKTTGLCGIDACSPAEVEHAISCGFKASEISFTACSLSRADFQQLAVHEDLIINCDSLHSISGWGKLRPGSSIGLRINPAVGTGREDNDKLQYAGGTITKFGIYRAQFQAALDLAKQFDLTIDRIHFHTGCGYLNRQLPQLAEVLKSSLWFIDQLPNLHTVNIGGGLGVPHTGSDQALDLQQWAATISQIYGDRKFTIAVEPGDYIVKDAGLLLLEKTFLEYKDSKLFVGVNAGFNIAPEPAYYSMPFQPVALLDNSNKQVVTIAGNINEALDIWYDNIELADLTEQNYLALINSGAYSASMASNHCMRGKFSEFLLF